MSVDNCAIIGGNTGGPDCGTKRKVPKKPVVGGKQFSSSEYADSDTFQAALLAAMKLPTGNASKLYAFPEIGKVAKTTEADTFGGLALTSQKRLRKGRPSYSYSVEVSQEEYMKLLAFDGKEVRVFHLDDASQFWGYRANSAANTPNTNPLKGELVYCTVSGNGFEDGENAETGIATITFSWKSIDDFEKRAAAIALPDLAPGDLVGLKDVRLSEPSAHASNVYKIKMEIPQDSKLGGDLNIFDDFGAAIAAMTFTAATGATYGTSLAVTSVAVDNTNKCLTVTFDSTAFAALAGGTKIKLTPPTAATLDAGDVTGIEIGTIVVTK
jgi:hypothetical protein